MSFRTILPTLIGCCIIHFCIGSVYSLSVLYKPIIEMTSWDMNTLVNSFSCIILVLGITASLHQKILANHHKQPILIYSILLWTFCQNFLISMVENNTSSIFYIIVSLILGISIGLLYVMPINIITSFNHKRTGLLSGLVISCFGIGSLVSAKLFSYITEYLSISSLHELYVTYGVLMLMSVFLIKTNSVIESIDSFSKDKKWYLLAIVYFCNIGIGISLLSNLVSLSTDIGSLTLELAVFLTALTGLSNTLGRIIYPYISDYIGKYKTILIILILQFIAVISLPNLWTIPVLIILSVYGGFFALMPGLMKEIYNKEGSIAYSQILSIWGISGFLSPLIFLQLNNNLIMLNIFSLVTILCILYFKKIKN